MKKWSVVLDAYIFLVIVMQGLLIVKIINAATPTVVDFFTLVTLCFTTLIASDSKKNAEGNLEDLKLEYDLKLKDMVRVYVDSYLDDNESSPVSEVAKDIEEIRTDADLILSELRENRDQLSKQIDESKRVLSNFNFSAMWHRKP
jgi:hypothetical protein